MKLEMDHHRVERVLDLVGHAGGQAAERRQPLGVAHERLDGHVGALGEHGDAIRLELLPQPLELPRQLLELVVRHPGRRDLELAAGEPPDLARQRAQGLEHEPREGPGHEPGQRQGQRGQRQALAQRRVELAPEQGRAEPEANAPEGLAVQVHRQHDLVRLPGAIEGEEARDGVLLQERVEAWMVRRHASPPGAAPCAR